MDVMDRNKAYNKYVKAKEPLTKWFPTIIWAFLIGGSICAIGQGIGDILLLCFKTMTIREANAWVSVILVFVAAFLTGLGIYDKLGNFAGAGSIVPITGFSNSVSSPAIEFKTEGLIFGTSSKIFSLAGPVILNGTAVSTIIGLIYLIFKI